MDFRKAGILSAHTTRWRVLGAAVVFPSPLLVAVFRNSALEGWNLLSAITFALLLTVWIGIIAWLISPIRNWRMFPVVLIALSCLLVRSLVFGPAEPTVVPVLILGSAAVLLFVAAVRIRAPTAEDVRLARIAEAPAGGGHVSGWIKFVGIAVLAILALLILRSLYEMLG
jgi:hypothetical protein